MPSTLTSFDNAAVGSGSIVNQVQLAYNSFSQLIADYQSHSGAVNTSSTPHVQMGYANGSANTIRPTTLTYPNGRVLTYDYGTSGGIDDAICRIGSLVDSDVSATHLADYSFLGLAIPVVVNSPQPSVEYTLVSLTGTNDPDTGDIYSGVDRFGRTKDCRYYNYGGSTDAVRLQYGYDRASNRLWRSDLVAQSLGKDFDELYAYDGLHRLKAMQRGLLTSGHTSIGSLTFAQCWEQDSTNNWTGFQEAATGGAATLVQTRSANPVNEISSITNAVGTAWATPAYDAAGNMTTIPRPMSTDLGWCTLTTDQWSALTVDQWADLPIAPEFNATFDAWNRTITVSDPATTENVQQTQYDARNFRSIRQDYSAGALAETRHFYYSPNWQSLEERLGASPSTASPERQQVWGLRYIDELAIRDRDTTGTGTLNERLYGLQDANWNVVALINASGTAQERYQYTPFGRPMFLSADMSAVLAASAIQSEILFTGQRLDPTVLIYLFRMRSLDPNTGVFTSRDPLGYPNGANTYAAWFVPNRPDPSGLANGPEVARMLRPAKTTRSGTCGLDITEKLQALIKALKNKMYFGSTISVLKACGELTGANGWDSPQLMQAGGGIPGAVVRRGEHAGTFESKTCGTNGCEGSVTIKGKCYWGAEVNYIVWGTARKMCNDIILERTDIKTTHDGGPDYYEFTQPGAGGETWSGYGQSYTATVAWVRAWRLTYGDRLLQDDGVPKYRDRGIGAENRVAWTKAGWNDDWTQAEPANINKCCSPCKDTYTGRLAARVGNTNKIVVDV